MDQIREVRWADMNNGGRARDGRSVYMILKVFDRIYTILAFIALNNPGYIQPVQVTLLL